MERLFVQECNQLWNYGVTARKRGSFDKQFGDGLS